MSTKLTFLSYGGGQDSWTILLKMVFDAAFRKEYAPGRLVVMMADTGDEHPETLRHVEYTKQFCKKHGIEFWHITPDMGMHRKSWISLRQHYEEYDQVGSKAMTKSCTESLKLAPMGNFMDWWIGREYGYKAGRKRAVKAFVADHGKIDSLIGIARGEEGRMQEPGKEPDIWRRNCINTRYPLVDIGMDRGDCQAYMRELGEVIPLPSNCILCPWMNEQELLWLYRFMPRDYVEWVRIERNKIDSDEKKYGERRNLGVWARTNKETGKAILLPDVLKTAQEKYGHMTDDELMDYKMSHGHCVMSKY